MDDQGAGVLCCFFFQAEDGIRDYDVTGVQTCALPIKAKKHVEKKKKLTAVERRDLEELGKEELKAAKEAERERKSEERKRKAEEEELARLTCKDNPEVKCPSTVLGTLKKLNIFKKN